jgi:hypothetical protein
LRRAGAESKRRKARRHARATRDETAQGWEECVRARARTHPCSVATVSAPLDLLLTSARLPKEPPPAFGLAPVAVAGDVPRLPLGGLAPAGDLRRSGDSGERPSGDVLAVGVPPLTPPKLLPLAVFTGRSGGEDGEDTAAVASRGGIARDARGRRRRAGRRRAPGCGGAC